MDDGEKLWLKAGEATRSQWEASGCVRFTYTSSKDGQPVARGMNYYSAPEEAMDSPQAMAPWSRLALEAALAARAPAKAPRMAPKKAPKAAPRKTARFCSACGTPVLQGARFCQHCGTVLAAE